MILQQLQQSGPMALLASVVSGDQFVASFCTPDHYKNTFRNFLGGLTPCFCDVILLGALPAHAGHGIAVPVCPSGCRLGWISLITACSSFLHYFGHL